MTSLRRATVVLLTALSLLLSGCGGEDVADTVDKARDKAREKARDIERDINRERDRLVKRFREILADIEKAVPTAPADREPPTSGGQTSASEIDQYLTEIIQDIDAYWTETLAESGLPEPRVGYVFIPPGERVRTGCRGAPGDEFAAFYCPADDTIYIGLSFAARLYEGLTEGLPGETGGTVGDFGVAYVVAHEYAHNVQTELGFYNRELTGQGARPFELQADCMAGLWGNSVFRRGLIQPGDVEEALNTALAVGDFEVGSEQHHGTPEERRDAWLDGYESGQPATCRRYLPGS